MAKEPNIYNLTVPAILLFPNLTAARAFKKNGKEQGDPKFDGTFMFTPEHADITPMKQVAIKAAKEMWPGRDIAADIKANNFNFPFRSGDKQADKRKNKSGKDDGDFMRGNILISGRSKYRPALAIIENGKITDLTDDAVIAAHKGKFYAGVEVLAQFNFQAFEGGNGPDGVNVYLNMVLSLNRGKKIVGSDGASAAQAFSGYVGRASAEDPTGDATDGQDPNAGLEGLI